MGFRHIVECASRDKVDNPTKRARTRKNIKNYICAGLVVVMTASMCLSMAATRTPDYEGLKQLQNEKALLAHANWEYYQTEFGADTMITKGAITSGKDRTPVNYTGSGYDYGYMLPKVSGSLQSGGSVFGQKFSDLPASHWAFQNVMAMEAQGKFTGYPDGTFKPKNTMSRAEFVTVVAKSLDADKVSSNAGGQWYDGAYATLNELGVLTSDSELAKANPKEGISREEMAYLASRALSYLGEKPSAANISSIPDGSAISSSYKNDVLKAYGAGILCGVDTQGTFKPQGTLTRAEAATVLNRITDSTSRVGAVTAQVQGQYPANIVGWNSAEYQKYRALRKDFYDKHQDNIFNEKYRDFSYYVYNSNSTFKYSSFDKSRNPSNFTIRRELPSKINFTTSTVSYDDACIDPIYQTMLENAGHYEEYTGLDYHVNAYGEGWIKNGKGEIVPYEPVTRVEGEYFERIPCEGDVIIKKDGTRVVLKATMGVIGLFQPVNVDAGWYGHSYAYVDVPGYNPKVDISAVYANVPAFDSRDYTSPVDNYNCDEITKPAVSMRMLYGMPFDATVGAEYIYSVAQLYANDLRKQGVDLKMGEWFYGIFEMQDRESMKSFDQSRYKIDEGRAAVWFGYPSDGEAYKEAHLRVVNGTIGYMSSTNKKCTEIGSPNLFFECDRLLVPFDLC